MVFAQFNFMILQTSSYGVLEKCKPKILGSQAMKALINPDGIWLKGTTQFHFIKIMFLKNCENQCEEAYPFNFKITYFCCF